MKEIKGVCGRCNHSEAYHMGARIHACRAWNPNEDDSVCACTGWEKAPAVIVTPAAPLPHKHWTE